MISAFGVDHGYVAKALTTPQPLDSVRGPVYSKAKADEWRSQGLKVEQRVHRNGKTAYARVGWHPNTTVRQGLLRRKRTVPDLTRVQYERAQ